MFKVKPALFVFPVYVICVLISAIRGFAEESLTITTYYPSPYGSYNSLQTDKLGVGDNNNDGTLTSADVPTTSGDVWIKGKVGIGTTGPNYQLHVTSTLGIGAAGLYQQQLSLGNNSIQSLDLGVGYTNMSLQALGGNVGIGTTSPSARLHVEQDPTSYKSTNICVRVNYTSATGIRSCPAGYYIAWGTTTAGAQPNGYVICCQACVDGGTAAPFPDPNGVCD